MKSALVISLLLSLPWAAVVALIGTRYTRSSPITSDPVWERFLVSVGSIAPMIVGFYLFWITTTPHISDTMTGGHTATMKDGARGVLAYSSTFIDKNLAAILNNKNIMGTLLLTYIIGLSLMVFKFSLANWQLYKIKRRAIPISNKIQIDAIFRFASRDISFNTNCVFSVAGLSTPIVTGLKTPRLIFPKECLDRLTPNELALVAAHEFEHIKRNDLVFGTMAGIMKIIYWFNPFFHILNERAQMSAEIACDRAALENKPNDRLGYAKILMSFHRLGSQRVAADATSFSRHKVKLEKFRIHAILAAARQPSHIHGSLSVRTLVKGLCMTTAAFGFGAVTVASAQSLQPSEIATHQKQKLLDKAQHLRSDIVKELADHANFLDRKAQKQRVAASMTAGRKKQELIEHAIYLEESAIRVRGPVTLNTLARATALEKKALAIQ